LIILFDSTGANLRCDPCIFINATEFAEIENSICSFAYSPFHEIQAMGTTCRMFAIIRAGTDGRRASVGAATAALDAIASGRALQALRELAKRPVVGG
jgi:hypothetical protein